MREDEACLAMGGLWGPHPNAFRANTDVLLSQWVSHVCFFSCSIERMPGTSPSIPGGHTDAEFCMSQSPRVFLHVALFPPHWIFTLVTSAILPLKYLTTQEKKDLFGVLVSEGWQSITVRKAGWSSWWLEGVVETAYFTADQEAQRREAGAGRALAG